LNELKKYSAIIAISIVLIIGAFFIGTQVSDSDSKDMKATTELESDSTKEPEIEMEDETADSKMDTSMSMGNVHDAIELNSSLPTPSVMIEVTKDSMMGYNLAVKTKNFEFKPENVNQDEGKTPQNEGHAHIYVNDVKLTRLYSKNFYIGDGVLKAGDIVSVTLNTNKHRDIVPSNEITI